LCKHFTDKVLPTIGTRGEVQPYIALSLGLCKAAVLGASIRAEPDGVVEAAQLIEACIGLEKK
jgi:hypothetical protein